MSVSFPLEISGGRAPGASLPYQAVPILGECPAIVRAVGLARRLAPTNLPILIVGPTGSGKEVFATAIHQWSGLRGAFVDVNCAALPRDMVEALLFGHRKGSYTRAYDNAPGLIEAANGGTLFLDELPSLLPEGQAKLLRVLDTGRFRRIGDTSNREARLRIIAAAQDDVAQMLNSKEFRLDLLQRISGAVIELPALADRGDDVVLLAERFSRDRDRGLGPGGVDVLRGHHWPGNIRELKLVIDRACALTDSPRLSGRALAESIELGGFRHQQSSVVDTLSGRSASRDQILAVLAASDWNAARASKALGLGRTSLFKLLNAEGISLRSLRSPLRLADPRERSPRFAIIQE